MDILNFILDNWAVIGSTTVLSTLFSLFIQHRLNKDSLVFKSTLDVDLEKLKSHLVVENNQKISELNTQLETVKSELALQNSRLQIAYSGILKDQIETLKKLYSLILEFEVALKDRKTDNNNPEVSMKPLIILDSFNKKYYENAIFIPKELDKKIMDILGFGFKQHYSDLRQQANEAAVSGNLEKANQLSIQAIENDLELYKLRDNFRDEIRSVLGLNV